MVGMGVVGVFHPDVFRRMSLIDVSSNAQYRFVGFGFILMGLLWVMSELRKG
jgi:hypothetical protein